MHPQKDALADARKVSDGRHHLHPCGDGLAVLVVQDCLEAEVGAQPPQHGLHHRHDIAVVENIVQRLRRRRLLGSRGVHACALGASRRRRVRRLGLPVCGGDRRGSRRGDKSAGAGAGAGAGRQWPAAREKGGRARESWARKCGRRVLSWPHRKHARWQPSQHKDACTLCTHTAAGGSRVHTCTQYV